MKLTFALLLCVVPVLWDLIIGRIYWRGKTVVNHFFTAGVRLAIMVVLSYYNPSAMIWQSLLLAVSFHTIAFPPLYNKLIIQKEWHFIGKTALLDRAEDWLRGKITGWGVITLKVAFLMTGIKFYVNPCVHWECWPF